MKYRSFGLILAAVALLAPGRQGSAQEEFPYQIFERYLGPLVQQIGIPGLSAVIVQGGPTNSSPSRVGWKKAYGYADVERKIPATVDTPYPIAGITQAMTGVLLGVCSDRHLIDDITFNNMRNFVPTFPVEETSVRQVLAHATGGRFQYNAGYFAQLTPVVEKCLGTSYRQAVTTEILDRLGMPSSVPGLDLARPEGAAARAQLDPARLAKYQALLAQVATPYRVDAKGRSTPSEYPSYGLDAAGGLVSTAMDLAQFEIELDSRDGIPISSSTLDLMWTRSFFTFPAPVRGQPDLTLTTPTGQGWFVTTESGVPLVWTFGHFKDASSALIVKMPEKHLTLILLANSGGLAEAYDLENANVTSSPFVKVFLRLFI